MVPPSLDGEYNTFIIGCQEKNERKNDLISDGNVTLDLNYLPLSGGTVNGDVNINGNSVVGGVIVTGNARARQWYTTDTTNGYYYLTIGVDDWDVGSRIQLMTADSPHDPSVIALTAGTNQLQIRKDSFIAGGRHIVRSVNGNGADANGNVSLNLNYLPLSGGTLSGNLAIAPYGSEGGEIALCHGTDAENGIILDTTGNNFRIYGTPNVGSVFVYNPQTAQLSVGSQHIVRSVNGVGAGTDGNVSISIPSAYVHPSTHPASMITGLAKVATSGSYNDLSNRPSIPSTTVSQKISISKDINVDEEITISITGLTAYKPLIGFIKKITNNYQNGGKIYGKFNSGTVLPDGSHGRTTAGSLEVRGQNEVDSIVTIPTGTSVSLHLYNGGTDYTTVSIVAYQ